MRQRLSLGGRTGPVQAPIHCGCDVLPWIECEHSAWDSGKSLDRVMQEAQEFHLTAPVQSEIFKTALPVARPRYSAPVSPLVLLLTRCRNMALWHAADSGQQGAFARRLIADIDAMQQEGMRS